MIWYYFANEKIKNFKKDKITTHSDAKLSKENLFIFIGFCY